MLGRGREGREGLERVWITAIKLPHTVYVSLQFREFQNNRFYSHKTEGLFFLLFLPNGLLGAKKRVPAGAQIEWCEGERVVQRLPNLGAVALSDRR